ncbi:hypothetical protein Q3G72_027785 [Acer saccharum]|nr:hypothetical protein Q3G72_027785 [Acer saccharum]
MKALLYGILLAMGYTRSKVAICSPGKKWWNILWKLNMPLKVKIFIWRACHDWIPTFVNLGKRGMDVDLSCSLCKNGNESTLHALWNCQKLKYARLDWLPKKTLSHRYYMNFLEFISDVASRTSPMELKTFCIACWRLWFLRNSFCHNGEKFNYYDVIWWSRNYAAECQAPYQVRIVVTNMNNHRVGIGIVIRDSVGSVMASCSQFLVASFDNNVAGIMAILRGILFSKDCGLSPCVLEFDNKVVVKRVRNRNLRNASYGSMLYKIDDLISQSFGLTISAIPISANQAVHRLAIFALESARNNYWMEDYAFCIRALVLADKPF